MHLWMLELQAFGSGDDQSCQKGLVFRRCCETWGVIFEADDGQEELVLATLHTVGASQRPSHPIPLIIIIRPQHPQLLASTIQML